MARTGRSRPACVIAIVTVTASFALAISAPSSSAATVITSPTCGQTVSGHVRLATDLVCPDVSALIVASSRTTIDLNGHSISCHGPGAGGSCQCRDADPFDECLGPEPDVGIDVLPDLNRVRIKGEGTISGFDFGIRLVGGSRNKIKDLLITSPVPDQEADRGETAGSEKNYIGVWHAAQESGHDDGHFFARRAGLPHGADQSAEAIAPTRPPMASTAFAR